MSLRARRAKQSRGLLVLLVFWVVSWLWPAGLLRRPFGPPRNDKPVSSIICGPLTASQKILLGFPLNLNQLTKEDWELLPGIGPSTAARIAEYQKAHGPFADLDALTEVKRIGPKTVESLRQFFDTPVR